MLDPKIISFGIKSIAAYDRKTKVPFGFAEVIGSGGIDLTGEVATLQGGASRFPWQNAHGFIEPKITVAMKEFPSFFYNLALGAKPVITRDNEAGLVRDIKNVTGTSLFGDSKFITGITIADKTNLKFGKYTAVMNDMDQLNIYASGDIDAGVGSEELRLYDNFLRINENPLAVASSSGGSDNDISVEPLGISLTCLLYTSPSPRDS